MAMRLSGLISGMDTDTVVKQMMEGHRLKVKKVQDKSTLLTWKQDKWKELNQKIYKLYTEDLNKMQLQSSYSTKKAVSTHDNIASVTASSSAAEGSHTLVVDTLAKAQYVTGKVIKKTNADNTTDPVKSNTKLVDLGLTAGQTITIGSKDLVIDDETSIKSIVDLGKKAGINASFDEKLGRFFLSSKNSGVANGFKVAATDIGMDSLTDDEKNAREQDILNLLGLDAVEAGGSYKNSTGNVSTVVAASDSLIYYNDAEIKGTTNELNVNGLKINIKSAAPGQTVTLNVTKDTQAAYDMVKNFVKSYNEVLKELNSYYYAASSKGYDPLSDEEKEAMTESQVEKWEKKIQDSILRRDSNLGSLIDIMRNKLAGSVAYNGTKYSLSSFGIKTSSDYMERGLLHIDGDKDDAISSGFEDKLMKSLEENPDAVIETLSSLSKDLYNSMFTKMRAIPNVRSSMTFYNDKTMVEQQKKYEAEIKRQESKLIDIENKYYKQFSAMESAMASLQQQSNNLASMLGMNNTQ